MSLSNPKKLINIIPVAFAEMEVDMLYDKSVTMRWQWYINYFLVTKIIFYTLVEFRMVLYV